MTSNVPPAIRRPASERIHAAPPNRDTLLRDAEYFATELVRRIERLAKLDSGQIAWQQAAALTRRIRGQVREQIDGRRHDAKTQAS